MKIKQTSHVNFKRALTSKEEKDFVKLSDKVDRLLEGDNYSTLLKVYLPALPSDLNEDTGSGKFDSNQTEQFFDLMDVYVNPSAYKLMPMGLMKDYKTGYRGAYERGSVGFGDDTISLAKLTTPEFANILSKEEVSALVKTNFFINSGYIIYANELGQGDNWPVTNILKKGWQNFKQKLASDDPYAISLNKEFKKFKDINGFNEVYERLALYPIIGNTEKVFCKF